MAIYDRTTKELMYDFAKERLKLGQPFGKREAVAWFADKYPKIRPTTVQMHVEGMSINSPDRRHHPSIKPTSGHDLFYKIERGLFRLWDKDNDPAPSYGDNAPAARISHEDAIGDAAESLEEVGATEFAYERDLQNYLAKNLNILEAGLRLYDDEGIKGVEYDAGGRAIDILAVDKNNFFVVVELKVSRGHEKTVGQILRYMGWIKKNLANGSNVRGIIVAKEITEDLRIAASMAPGVQLAEYEISFKLKPLTD